MSLNDLHPIRRLRQEQSWLFESVTPAPRPRKVVIYSMDPWQLGVFEPFLHLALLRKGHRPASICYDGLLPITAWENAASPPPPLEVITGRFDFIHRCLGTTAAGISGYLDEPAARRLAQDRVGAVPDETLAALEYRDLPIGRIARRDLFQYTLGCFEPDTPGDVALFRRHLVHAVMSVDLAHAILDAEQPDIVVLANGKSVMYSYMYEVSRQRRVQVTTWEEGIYFDDSIVLANNDRAIDFPISGEEWDRIRQLPIPPGELAKVDQYFLKWRNQQATHYVYYDNEERDVGRICDALDIPREAPKVALFPNLIWDTNALDKDLAFAGMMDWIFTTIDFFAARPQEHLVIRAHPAEVRLKFKTRTPVAGLIARRYPGGLPANVHVIDPSSEFSSYEIARDARLCAVYTSTLGVELSLMGLCPLICGVPFYAGKGLTNDMVTRQEYLDLLAGRHQPRPVDGDLLRRFLHAVIFRLAKRPEFFCGTHGHPQQPRIRIDTFEGFPESMPIFDEIVECVLAGGSFVPLGERIAACPA